MRTIIFLLLFLINVGVGALSGWNSNAFPSALLGAIIGFLVMEDLGFFEGFKQKNKKSN